jgi:hypothetical protein
LRGHGALALLLAAVLSVGSASSYDDAGDVVAAAKQEKKLVIYSVVHADVAVRDLLSAFHHKYPFIQIINSDGDGALTYKRFKREIAAGKDSADFIWSSAMDLQEKLINDGLSLPYASPEMPYLPSWAHWQDLGYGVTLEPIAIVYNRRFLSPKEMPQSHAGLKDLLIRESGRLEHRVALYNPESSEVGMLLLSQDIRVTRDSWDLFDALGKVKAELYNTSRDTLLNIIECKRPIPSFKSYFRATIRWSCLGSPSLPPRRSTPTPENSFWTFSSLPKAKPSYAVMAWARSAAILPFPAHSLRSTRFGRRPSASGRDFSRISIRSSGRNFFVAGGNRGHDRLSYHPFWYHKLDYYP